MNINHYYRRQSYTRHNTNMYTWRDLRHWYCHELTKHFPPIVAYASKHKLYNTGGLYPYNGADKPTSPTNTKTRMSVMLIANMQVFGEKGSMCLAFLFAGMVKLLALVVAIPACFCSLINGASRHFNVNAIKPCFRTPGELIKYLHLLLV